jgi:cell division protease FtsH
LRDEYSMSRRKLLGQMRVLYGGRVAEEVLGRDMTSGAAADIRQATEIARHMICEWGMSEKLGPIHFEMAHENVFLGYEISQPREFSEETARVIDEEVRRLAESAYAEARRLVEDNRDALLRIKAALIEREVLNHDEVESLIAGRELSPREVPAATGSGRLVPDGEAEPRDDSGAGSGDEGEDSGVSGADGSGDEVEERAED